MNDPVAEAWGRITTWLARWAPRTSDALNPPATAETLARAERELGFALPPALAAWWRINDGMRPSHQGHVIPAFKLYSVTRMLDSRRLWLRIAAEVWSPDVREAGEHNVAGQPAWAFLPEFVPIGWDGSGDDLLADLRRGPLQGCVRRYNHQEGALGPPLWPGVPAMLEEVARALERGNPIRFRTPVVRDGTLTWVITDGPPAPA
ncbi:SMI1/KNR4 family protein [Nonomuraea sp. CA-141351]|uniref:SMI1/KNR4 family protein n=1 Tax=Nonomuraea sp. CA-141351 TaxID=3239996 RepID=UPI003D8F054A